MTASTTYLVLGFLSLFATCCTAFPTTKPAISTLYQFAKGSWLENLAVGPTDDSILATRVDKPYLYRFNLPHSAHGNASAELVHIFSHYQSLEGITEYAPKSFAVIAGNLSLTDLGPGNYSIYSVQYTDDATHAPAIHKIVTLPNSEFFLNGMTTLDCEKGTVLLCDSLRGQVYRLDTQTGAYELVLEDDTMKPETGDIGVNGIHTVALGLDTYLYYDNMNRTTINRVRIDPVTGRPLGPYTTLAHGYNTDDFAFDDQTSDVYAAGQTANVLVRVTPDGRETAVAGAVDQLTVAGPTSAVFGRGKRRRTLFVTTNGASKAPVNGTITEGAKLMAIQVDRL